MTIICKRFVEDIPFTAHGEVEFSASRNLNVGPQRYRNSFPKTVDRKTLFPFRPLQKQRLLHKPDLDC